MHVLVNQVRSDDAIGTSFGQNFVCIDQLRSVMTGRRRPIDLIDPAVGAKTQRIEIARSIEMLFGRAVVSKIPPHPGNTKFQFRVLVVDLLR